MEADIYRGWGDSSKLPLGAQGAAPDLSRLIAASPVDHQRRSGQLVSPPDLRGDPRATL